MKSIYNSIPLLLVLLVLFSCSKNPGSVPESIKYSLTISSSPSIGGTVSPSSGTYGESTVVRIQGTPSTGYSFIEWKGSIQSTQNPLDISMDSNKNITSVFELSDTENPIYLDQNGVTIKCYDWGEVGDTGVVNGNTYTIVDLNTLYQMVEDNEDVTKICTTKITYLSGGMFHDSTFNQDIGSWDVSNVTDMSSLFYETPFNQDISSWDVSNAIDMASMFINSSFNQPIGNWDVSNVISMGQMFDGSPFDQDISSWDVSSATSMDYMFANTQFNQPIGNWDVGNVTDMRNMFNSSQFNQDISSWDVSNVQYMPHMFESSQFNQDLSGWDVNNVLDCPGFSNNTPLWLLPKPNFTNCTP